MPPLRPVFAGAIRLPRQAECGAETPEGNWQVATAAAGAYLCRVGEPAGSIIRIRKGTAELLAPVGADGVEAVLRTLGPDEVVGLTEAIAKTGFSVSLRAATDCEFEYLDADEFRQMLASDGRLRRLILRRLARGLQHHLDSFDSKDRIDL
ncbi:MAG: cyclic nucleotide-binding domain-containing protein [Pyrinomonadaceae bacterium]